MFDQRTEFLMPPSFTTPPWPMPWFIIYRRCLFPAAVDEVCPNLDELIVNAPRFVSDRSNNLFLICSIPCPVQMGLCRQTTDTYHRKKVMPALHGSLIADLLCYSGCSQGLNSVAVRSEGAREKGSSHVVLFVQPFKSKFSMFRFICSS